jgi:putative transposase
LIVDDVKVQCKRSGMSLTALLKLYGVSKSAYYNWFGDDGLKPEVPRKPQRLDGITADEEAAVVAFRKEHGGFGYRKLSWMMVDADVAYMSETSVYNILSRHDLLYGWNRADNGETEKEYRHKPKYVHHHWHTDIAYIKIRMLLDGYSRYLLAWELMTDMTGRSVELFIQRAKERYPHARPMLINDNGSQFISHDFKKLVTKLDIQQVFTRRNHPQTNGKIERMNGTVKNEALRPGCPNSYQEACEILNNYDYEYNHQRLHAGIKYLRPSDMFFGREKIILNVRRQKLLKGKKLRIKTNQQRLNLS